MISLYKALSDRTLWQCIQIGQGIMQLPPTYSWLSSGCVINKSGDSQPSRQATGMATGPAWGHLVGDEK